MFQRHKYKELSKVNLNDIPNPVSSIKYDGANYFLNIDQTGKPSFISRRPSVTGEWLNRTSKLPQFSNMDLPEYSDHVFNVELIHTGHNKNNVESHPASSGILNSLPAKAIETQRLTGPIRAVLFDVIKPNLKTYQEKIDLMQKFVDDVNKPNVLYLPEFKIGVDEAEKLIQSTEKEGREGVIITSLTHPEHESQRIKVKHLQTWNLLVTGMTQEIDIHGNPKASMGALVVADKTGKEVANVGGGWTKAQREEIFHHFGAWKNKLIQVRGMSPTAHRIRAPQYNGDADGNIDEV